MIARRIRIEKQIAIAVDTEVDDVRFVIGNRTGNLERSFDGIAINLRPVNFGNGTEIHSIMGLSFLK